jgi:cytidylate kinase
VCCDGQDVTSEIRTPEVTENIYHVADQPAVRKAMRRKQRAFARRHDMVAEGRDQGTEVFPDAEMKFYLDASLQERARRRLLDLRGSGDEPSMEEVRRQVAQRDARDRSRPVGALRHEEDMIVIDSTDKSIEEVVEEMISEIERRRLLPDQA